MGVLGLQPAQKPLREKDLSLSIQARKLICLVCICRERGESRSAAGRVRAKSHTQVGRFGERSLVQGDAGMIFSDVMRMATSQPASELRWQLAPA
jgi:hypothetical protein